MIIDQEGDTSRDFARGGVVQFPSSMGLVAGSSPERAYQVAVCVSRQMKASGLDMIHSPVVDVNINPKNPEIGYRAFSDDPEVVAEYALAMLKGFQENKVIAAAKHFPGRGDSATDAHHACPVLNVDADRFEKIELYPVQAADRGGHRRHHGGPLPLPAHRSRPDLDGVAQGGDRHPARQAGLRGDDHHRQHHHGGAHRSLRDRRGLRPGARRRGGHHPDEGREPLARRDVLHHPQVGRGRPIKADELDDKVRRILAIKKKYGLFDDMGRVDAEQGVGAVQGFAGGEDRKAAAQHAILVAKDELGALPLDKSKRVLLINQQYSLKTPNDVHDHPALFAPAHGEEWPSLQTYETSFGFNEKEDEAVVRFVQGEEQYDLVICTNYYDRAEKPHTYVKALIDKGLPVLLITNTPYCIKDIAGLIPQARTIVLNLNLTPEGLRTTREVLLGRLEPQRQLAAVQLRPAEAQALKGDRPHAQAEAQDPARPRDLAHHRLDPGATGRRRSSP